MKKNKVTKKCEVCGETFSTWPSHLKRGQGKTCGNKCSGISRSRENCHLWNGGKIIDKSGYILIYTPHHPNCSRTGYVREHRLVMEKIIGRFLLKSEIVHHINEDKKDNREENLELCQFNKHRSIHASVAKRDKYGKFSKTT
jgi:hypothetical protein